MRILVTGGAGFIGSHLCERLLEEGNEVICLDNFFTGSKRNIVHLLDNHRFELIRHDVIEPILLEVDRIYNLACPASPVHYQYNPVKTTKTSVMGTINMLGMAKRVRARILLASTSEVYGDPLVHPQTEAYWGNVNPIGIRSCYDEGKRVAETLMMDYHRQNKVDIRIVRIFNTYGPRMAINDGRVVSNFIVQALKCDGFIGPVNLGNPGETTIYEFAQRIVTLTGASSRIVFNPLPADDPKQRQPDITLARQRLGWEPQVPVAVGLKKTIDYFSGILA